MTSSGQATDALGHEPPAAIRKLEAVVLMHVFARAFDVEPPSMRRLSANESLRVFREFTAACMEMAAADERVSAHLRSRLGASARALGRVVRAMTAPLPSREPVACYLYRGIGIELSLDGERLCFGLCSFAQRYSATDCWFMSAFDEGFLQGLLGREGDELAFCSRITQGAPKCQALFKTPGQPDGRT